MHGSEGGRWKRGEGGIRDRYPWAPARKGGNRAAGCKSYHRVIPPPRQRPTLPAFRKIRPIWDKGDILAMRTAWGDDREFGDDFADRIVTMFGRLCGG